MASEGWDIGDVWEPRGTFTVAQTTAIGSPTAVSLYVTAPGSTGPTEYTYAGGTVSLSTDGYFYKQIPLTASGTWSCRYKGTGTIISAAESYIEVRDQLVST